MPRKRGARVRIAPGIYRDDIGYSVQLMVRGRRIEKRFPRGTALSKMKDWRDGKRIKRRGSRSDPDHATFAEDVRRYLKTAKHMPTYDQREYDLNQWITALGGARPRSSITGTELDQVMADWMTTPQPRGRGQKPAPLNPQTVKLRRTALRRMYRVLDGESAPNIVRDSTAPQEYAAEARGLSMTVVRDIFDAMPANEWRPRLKLLAFAGLPPKLLGQVEAGDVFPDTLQLRVRGRRKGRGAAGSVRPITPQAAEAFAELGRFDAFGEFDAWRQFDAFSSAVRRVNAQRKEDNLPPLTRLKPYDLRHSFGTWLYEQTGDLATVARLLGVTLQTARRYALGATNVLDVRAIRKLGQTMGAVMGAVISSPDGSKMLPTSLSRS
jgi:integrase